MCLKIFCDLYRCEDCHQLYLVSYEAIVPNKHHEPEENDFACYCNDKVTWYAETSEASGSDNSGNAIAQRVDLVVEGEGQCQLCYHAELDGEQEKIDNRRALGYWPPLEMLADMGKATVNPDGSIILEVGRHLMQDFLKGSIVPKGENDFYVLIVHKAAHFDDLAKYLMDSDKSKPWWTTIDNSRCWVTQDACAIGDVELELTPQRVREESDDDEAEKGEDDYLNIFGGGGGMGEDGGFGGIDFSKLVGAEGGDEEEEDDEDDDNEELDDDGQFEEGEQDDHRIVYYGNDNSNTEYQQRSSRLP